MILVIVNSKLSDIFTKYILLTIRLKLDVIPILMIIVIENSEKQLIIYKIN